MEEGKLKLTDPVAKYIPEFKSSKVAVEAVHTSAPQKLQQARTPTETLADFIPRLGALALDFQPGTHYVVQRSGEGTAADRHDIQQDPERTAEAGRAAQDRIAGLFLRCRRPHVGGARLPAIRTDALRRRASEGAYGTYWWVNRKEQMVVVLFVQTSGRSLQYDFDNAVSQAVIE
jgi:CubicO group peptidase (beta-lactamase class C family)